MNIDLAALPDDIETLQRMVRSLAAERTALSEAQAEIERLRLIVQKLQRSQFGRRAERLDVGQVRIEDPDTFNEPWSAVQHYRRVSQEMQEEACAENNAHLFDYHIPVAEEPDF